eukprot:3933935-Rhodomonas_salina.3
MLRLHLPSHIYRPSLTPRWLGASGRGADVPRGGCRSAHRARASHLQRRQRPRPPPARKG